MSSFGYFSILVQLFFATHGRNALAYANVDADYELESYHLRGPKSPSLRRKLVELAPNFEGITVPDHLDESYANITDSFNKTIHTPFYWHVPKAGGTSVKGCLAECYDMVEATETGVLDGHADDETLEIVVKESGIKYVNVDTTTRAGIRKAKDMGLVPSRLADVIFTGFLHEATEMFEDDQKGVMFGIFRHPVDRAVSMFYYLQVADWEPTYSPEYQNLTLSEYATSGMIEENWMTRILSKKLRGPLTKADLNRAKLVVQQKMIVGLATQMDESLRRFETYFDLKISSPDDSCREKYVKNKGVNGNKHPRVEEGSQEWDLIMESNVMDFDLYEYVRRLFHIDQAAMFPKPIEVATD